MMLTKMLALFLLLVSLGSNAEVTIKGKLNFLFKGYIYYNEPIDGFGDMYLNDQQVAVAGDSTFTITATIKKEGFFLLKLPGKSLWLFVEPNDSLSFTASYVINRQQQKYLFDDIRFTGNNAAGHRRMAVDSACANVYDYSVKGLFIQKCTTLQQFHQNILLALQRSLQPADSLYTANAIDAGYYKAVTADIKSQFGYGLLNLFMILEKQCNKQFSTYSSADPLYKALSINSHLFTPVNVASTKLFIYKTIDPFNENIVYAPVGYLYTQQYCKDILSGLVKDHLSYDPTFISFPAVQYLGYLKGRFLEVSWKSYLYWMTKTEPDGKVLEKNLQLFRSYFPRSGFLPYLNSRFSEAIKDRALASEEQPDIEFITGQSYNSLHELLKARFEDDYVFVDLWATWCAPCIREFANQNQLKSFLEEKNIRMLYISIDRQSDKDKWKSLVASSKLTGAHFFASEKFLENVRNELYNNEEVLIPRYLLIGKSGKIIGSDMPRPGDWENLKRTINKLINKS